jgi:radical SAM protein with 4Fe4S-binding SPASM domain
MHKVHPLYCALQPNGNISPCVFMPSPRIGNLRENSLMDMRHNNHVLNKLLAENS